MVRWRGDGLIRGSITRRGMERQGKLVGINAQSLLFQL
jgi:hypothetical protein